MPRPVFIICSQSSLIEADSNLLSILKVIEGYDIEVEKVTAPGSEKGGEERRLMAVDRAIPGLAQFHVHAVWMRQEDEETGQEYEYEFVIRPPKAEPKSMPGSERIVFNRRFIRVNGIVMIASPWRQSGIAWIEVKIRKPGHEWLSQEYPIPINVHVTESATQPPTGA